MRIVHSIDISATPGRVFSWLNDPRRAAVWMTSVVRTEIIAEFPQMIGTRFRERIEENGRGTEMEGVVTG
jgi:hypothetical protein